MAEPTGKIVGRPMVKRACGHEQEFQYYAVDKYRAQRQAKFASTRCSNCAEKLIEEQRKAAEAMPSKVEAVKSLPAGTSITITRQKDGSWSGVLEAGGKKVDVAGNVEAGPQSLIPALARLWLA